MKARIAVGGPYRVGAVVPRPARRPTDGERIDLAVVIAQIAIVLLCAARAGVDVARGGASVEGALAVVLLAVAGFSLAANRMSAAGRCSTPASIRRS